MTTDTDKPLVSIGMPTYNGEPFIRQSLDSLLAQDYENFELLISDNASTDRTGDICREYAAKDNRIQYYRNETNRGAVYNFNRVLELSTGEYFVWAADHDLWQATFISRCVSILETEPEVVLAYPHTRLIGCDGQTLPVEHVGIDTRGMKPLKRYKHLIWNLVQCDMVYGVFRREALSGVRFSVGTMAPDNVLLADLAFKGAFAQIPERLFCRRKNRADETWETGKRRILETLAPSTAPERAAFSYERLMFELRAAHLQVVAHVHLSWFDRLRATISTYLFFRLRLRTPWRSRPARMIEAVVTSVFPIGLLRRVACMLSKLEGAEND